MTTQPKDLMTLEDTIASLVKERYRAKSGITRVTKGIADYEAEGDLHSKSICELSLLDWQEMLSRAESALHHLEVGRRDLKRLATAVTLSAPSKYLSWANAGGVDECAHGRGAGVPCFQCDLALAESILKPTAPTAQEVKG